KPSGHEAVDNPIDNLAYYLLGYEAEEPGNEIGQILVVSPQGEVTEVSPARGYPPRQTVVLRTGNPSDPVLATKPQQSDPEQSRHSAPQLIGSRPRFVDGRRGLLDKLYVRYKSKQYLGESFRDAVEALSDGVRPTDGSLAELRREFEQEFGGFAEESG